MEDWRHLEDQYGVSVKCLQDVWREFKLKDADGVPLNEYFRPNKRGRPGIASERNEEVEQVIDSSILSENNNVNYREIRDHLEDEHIPRSLSTVQRRKWEARRRTSISNLS